MPRRLGWGLLLLAALAVPAAAQRGPGQGGAAFDGQYVGELTLSRIIDGDCATPPLAAVYPLTVAGGRVEFKYVPRFSTVLVGQVDRNGNFSAAARARKGWVRMTGRLQGDRAEAEITSPSCAYRFRTK